MIRKRSGNAFIQYAIILILIAVGVVVVYTLLGKNITNNLSFFSNTMDKAAKSVSFTGNDGSVKSYQPGDLKGSPSSPVSECNANECILDYGDYILSGIPANFSDESTSSRGTDQLAKLMGNMISQLEAENDPPNDDLTALINLINQAVIKTDIIGDAEQVLEVAALDVYLGQEDQFANEHAVLQNIIENFQTNPQYKNLVDAGLIVLPAQDEPLGPETQLFVDGAWVNDSKYSENIMNVLNIKPATNELDTLKTAILEAANNCGKQQQGNTIAYLIDIITDVSNSAQQAASNGEQLLEVKSIIDNKNISLKDELINIAQQL